MQFTANYATITVIMDGVKPCCNNSLVMLVFGIQIHCETCLLHQQTSL